MTILVTGAAGFIGAALCRRLLERGSPDQEDSGLGCPWECILHRGSTFDWNRLARLTGARRLPLPR